MHTGREGMSAMPFFDDFDLSTVDILLISQYVQHFLVSSSLSHRCNGMSLSDGLQWFPVRRVIEIAEDLNMYQGHALLAVLYSRTDQYNYVQPLPALPAP